MADTYPDKISPDAEAVHLPLPKFQYYTCKRENYSSYQWNDLDSHVLNHPGEVKVEVVNACGQPFLTNLGREHLCNDPRGHTIHKRHNVRRHKCVIHGCYEADGAVEKAMNEALLETVAAFKKNLPPMTGRQRSSRLKPQIRAAQLKAAPGVGR